MHVLPILKKHSIVSYIVFAYAIPLGGLSAALAFGVINTPAINAGQIAAIFIAMLLGPSVSAITLTILLEGRPGLTALWRRMTHYRTAPRWYAVALLTTPVLLVPNLMALSIIIGPAYTPHVHLPLLAIGLVASAFEEIGWTGFAAPRLFIHYDFPVAGLILGLVWAIWHALADFVGNAHAAGDQWWLWFGVFWLATLPPYRLLMTWV